MTDGSLPYVEGIETGPKGNQGTVGSAWSESPVCPVSLRRRHSRAIEDSGVGGAVAPARTRSRQPWTAEARWRDRRLHESEGGSADWLERKELAVARQVCRRSVGSGQAGLDPEARRSRGAGPTAPGRRWRWLDLVIRCLGMATSEVDRCRHQVSRCRHWWLHLETA